MPKLPKAGDFGFNIFMSRPSFTIANAIHGALSNLCPQCFEGKVFEFNPLKMRRKCQSCGYIYERESGYFLGAMIFSYALGAFGVVPTFVIGVMVLRASIFDVTAAGCLQVLLLFPFLFKYSRLVWMHLDYRADPIEKKRA